MRRYINRLVDAIRDLAPAIELVALGGRLQSIPSYVVRQPEPPHPPTNAGWSIVGLPLAAVRAGVDLIHAPAYTGPFLAGVPVVLTVHDVSYAVHPEWSPTPIGLVRQWFYRRSAVSATRILTVSRFSASEIARTYGIDAARIAITPLGVDPVFSPGDPNLLETLPAAVTGPYVLHVGDLHERRNLALIVDALAEVRRRFGSSSALSLVLAGIDRGVKDGLCDLAAHAGIGEAVVYLGPVSDDRLRSLYRQATALVYPSLYEGFGLPLIEAMASGTPVIASNVASMPEVVGQAALLVDPTSGQAWADAIASIVNDERKRTHLRQQGLARAAEFTWARTAELTIAAYRQALAA